MSDIQIKLGNQSLVLAENGNVKEFNDKSISQITHNDFEQIQNLLNKAAAGETGINIRGLNTKDAAGQISFIKNARDGFQKVYSAIIASKALERNAKLNREYIGKANVASEQIGAAKDGIGNGSVSFTKFGADIYSGLVNVFNYESKISDLRNNAGPAAAVVTSNPAISEASHQQCSEAIGGALLSVKTANDAIGLLQGITKQYAMLPISHKTGGKFSNIFTNIASFFKNICNTIFRNSENTGKVAELVNKVISTKLSGSEAISHAALAGIVMYEAGKKNPDMKVIADCVKHIGGDFKAATKSEDKAAIAESLNIAVSSLRNLKCEAKACQELSQEIKDLAVPMIHDKSTRDYRGLMNVMLKKDNPLSIYRQSSNVNKDVNEFVANVLKQGSNFINDFDSSFVHSMIKELKPDSDSLVPIFGIVGVKNEIMVDFLKANSEQLSLSDISTLLSLSKEIGHTRAEAAVIQKWPFASKFDKYVVKNDLRALDQDIQIANLEKAVIDGQKEIKHIFEIGIKQDKLGDGISSLAKKLDGVGDKMANVGPDGLQEGEVKVIQQELKDCEKGAKQIKDNQAAIVKDCKAVEKFAGKDMNQKLNMVNNEHDKDMQIIDGKLVALKDAVDVVAVQVEQQQVEKVAEKKGMSTGKKVAIAVGCVVAVGAAVAGVVYGVKNPEQIVAAGRLIKGYADVAGKAVAGFVGKVWSGAKAGVGALKDAGNVLVGNTVGGPASPADGFGQDPASKLNDLAYKANVGANAGAAAVKNVVKGGFESLKKGIQPGIPFAEDGFGKAVSGNSDKINYQSQAEVRAKIESEAFKPIIDDIIAQDLSKSDEGGLLKKIGGFFGKK